MVIKEIADKYCLDISFSKTETSWNIHVKESYKINKSELIKAIVNDLVLTEEYKSLDMARPAQSLINEWKAHNVLYNWNIKRSQTESVDLDSNETFGRKLIYAILAFLY